MPVSPVGGQFISSYGGALGFLPYQGILPSQGAVPSVVNQSLLDVVRWEMVRQQFLDDTTHTGSFAAQGNDVACMGFKLAAEVVWNLYNPPNFLAQNGGLFSAGSAFDLGYQVWAYIGSGLNYPSDLGPYYYFAPSAKCSSHQTVIDAGGKKMVRARIDIIGNSPIFALGGTVGDLAQYSAYIAHCQTRGWAF